MRPAYQPCEQHQQTYCLDPECKADENRVSGEHLIELPGMWEVADLVGGQTDVDL